MNIACPECQTLYRIDPERVPEEGATTVCRSCETAFRVERGMGGSEPGEHATGLRVEAATRASATEAAAPVAPPSDGLAPEESVSEESLSEEAEAKAPAGAPAFGPQDPETRARRLARALVSDIKVYHPEKWEESAAAGTLRTDFRDEILKSWEEYVEQVGEDMAKKTPYFRDALNDILARGNRVF